MFVTPWDQRELEIFWGGRGDGFVVCGKDVVDWKSVSSYSLKRKRAPFFNFT